MTSLPANSVLYHSTMLNNAHPLLAEIIESLDSDWAEDFSYEIGSAKNLGIVTIRWKRTNTPLPLKFELSSEAFETTTMPRREIIAKIKEQLPANLLKERMTRANSILRLIGRRAMSNVQNDLNQWIEETSQLLKKIYGREIAQAFSSSLPFPSDIKNGTARALQWIVENKFEYLKEL